MARDLLARLEASGIQLSAEDGKIRVNAAKGQLTDALRAEITAKKPELLELLGARTASAAITRVSRDAPLRLSLFQERLWIIHSLEPKGVAYNMVAVWLAPPGATAEQAVLALEAVVGRHEILHAVYRDDESGTPSMQIVPPPSLSIRIEDATHLSLDEGRAMLDAAVKAAAKTPFDLSKEPSIRFVVYRGADRVAILAAAHHIAVDAWSMSMLEREVAAAFGGPVGPEPAIQYADYAAWQRNAAGSAKVDADLDWWAKTLAGIPPVSTFPADRQRGTEGEGATLDFRFSRELSEGIRALARARGATAYMAFLAACAVVLRWQTGQEDIVLGSPMGDRERPELEDVIGAFVNLLVLRLDLSGDPTFEALLVRAREAMLAAHEHRGVPFERLIERLKPARSFEHTPLFQIAVVLHNATAGASTPITSGGALFDLTWFIRDVDGHFQGSFEYRADVYSKELVERLAQRLEAVLASAVHASDKHLSELSLLSSTEARRALHELNDTTREVDRAPFIAQFERQAAATPTAAALRFEGKTLTYAELDTRANDLARLLSGAGVSAGAIVGLCIPRSFEMVVALLAVQKAGAAYLPLDPDFPRDRLTFMVEDSGARTLVTSGDLPIEVPAGVTRIELDANTAPGAAVPAPTPVTPTSLAYVIYTSGSTGKPKGVRVGHAALSNFLASMRDEPGIRPADVLAAVTTLSFDIAGLELYLPLTVGACIEIVPKAVAADGAALTKMLGESGATLLQATPSTWRLLLEAGWQAKPGFRALCGGEPLGRELADGILGRASELWNLYGPTETTIWSTAQRIEAGAGAIQIGKPIANTRIYILNRDCQPLPIGVPGELWIGGDGLAEGYHERSDLTGERFVPDPFSPTPGARMYRTGDLAQWDADGRLTHLGRVDHQVKVRGFRIELGEIESVLTSHPAVKHAFVLAREAGPGDVRLVAYVGYQPGEDLTVSDVRRHLRTALPDYMIPSLVVTLDTIPLTPNGKLDRAALPDPFAHATASREVVPPEPGLETTLAEIWRDVLKLPAVGATDNFFELGGHSLLSLRVAAALEKRTGWRMDPRMLFFQNLRQIATAATSAGAKA